MPRMVKGPDGITHSFPDDATDAEISEALSTPPSTARGKPARTWTDTAVDALPMVGGMAGGIVGGIGGTVLGMGVGGVPGAVGGATLGGGAGEAARQLVNRYRGAEAPSTPLEAATGIATQAGIQGAAEGVGQAIPVALGAGAKAVYRGYLKPSLAKQSVGKAAQVVDTALKEALPLTEAGSAHAQQVITDLRGQVDGLLQQSNGTIDLKQIADKVRAFAKTKYFKAGKPTEDFDAAMRVADSIDQHPSVQNPFNPSSPAPVNLSKANEIKRGLDESIGEANFGIDRGATKTAQKVGRREIRQGIEAQVPQAGPLNAREGRLIDAAKAITKAVARDANQNQLYGVKTIAAAAYGGEDFHRNGDPYTAAVKALSLRMALTPAVVSRAAIVASRLGRMSGSVPATVAKAAVQAVSEAEQQTQGSPEDVQR